MVRGLRRDLLVLPDGVLQDGEGVAAVKEKQSSALLLGVADIGVVDPDNDRTDRMARQRLADLE